MKWLLLIALTATAHADARTDLIARALDAVHAQGKQLEPELYQAARTRCPQLGGCADALIAEHCHDAACSAAADVIVTNLRAANTWVDEATRARLVRGSTDYHAALAVELRKRYAALAAELVVAGGDNAAAIDAVCATRDRAIHVCKPDDVACVPSLPWPRCVAALVWFIGVTP